MSKIYDLYLFNGKKDKCIKADLLFSEAMDIINKKINNKEVDLSKDVFLLMEFNGNDSMKVSDVICLGNANNILLWTRS